jgi:hypothetical protein
MNTETIISLAAAIISLCAISISIWQGYLMRKHNRISVKPILSFGAKLKSASGKNKIIMSNNGLGTAILKELRIFVNGDFIGLADCHENWHSALQKAEAMFEGGNHTIFAGDFPIMAGETINLLTLIDDITDDQVLEILGKFDFEVKYECLYGKKYFVSRRS